MDVPRVGRRAKAPPGDRGKRTEAGRETHERETAHIDQRVRARAYRVDQGCREDCLCAIMRDIEILKK